MPNKLDLISQLASALKRTQRENRKKELDRSSKLKKELRGRKEGAPSSPSLPQTKQSYSFVFFLVSLEDKKHSEGEFKANDE
jgi:hypothetical protein